MLTSALPKHAMTAHTQESGNKHITCDPRQGWEAPADWSFFAYADEASRPGRTRACLRPENDCCYTTQDIERVLDLGPTNGNQISTRNHF